MIKMGVLALQGSFKEHMAKLSLINGVEPIEVKNPDQIKDVSGIIIPGGESTTIGKLLREYSLIDPVVSKVKTGMPIWGTCAGMIIMAKQIENENIVHMGIMDISIVRNAYGSQLNSFETKEIVDEVSDNAIPLVFIRAPWVSDCSNKVKVLAKLDGKIIAVRQDNMIATSFHPELTNDLLFHKYFVDIVKKQM